MVLHIMFDRADSVIQMFHLHHRTLHLCDLVFQHDLFRPLFLQGCHVLIDAETEHDSPKQHKRCQRNDKIQRRIFFIQQYRGPSLCLSLFAVSIPSVPSICMSRNTMSNCFPAASSASPVSYNPSHTHGISFSASSFICSRMTFSSSPAIHFPCECFSRIEH